MKTEEQRITIAEICGIEEIEFINAPNGGWFGSDENGDSVNIPDYPNDLNAMYEAEKILKEPDKTKDLNLLGNATNRNDFEWDQVHSTASQRAEAFLKTLGLWKES